MFSRQPRSAGTHDARQQSDNPQAFKAALAGHKDSPCGLGLMRSISTQPVKSVSQEETAENL